MDLYFAAFLTIPLVLLAAKELGWLRSSIWLIFFVYIVVGWLLVYLSVESYQRSLDNLVRNTPNPSEELLKNLQNDGAARVFATYFGWAHSVIYFWISYCVVKATSVIIKMRSN